MNDKLSLKPCPICQQMMYVIGVDSKGKKIASCGHKFSFRQTRSQKEMSRKYIKTEYGLELAPPIEKDKSDVVNKNTNKDKCQKAT